MFSRSDETLKKSDEGYEKKQEEMKQLIYNTT